MATADCNEVTATLSERDHRARPLTAPPTVAVSQPPAMSVWPRASRATIEGAAQLVDRVTKRIVEHISSAQ